MTNTHPMSDRLVRITEAAEIYSVHPKTFRRWADRGLVPPGTKLGGARLWRLDVLKEHIRTNCPKIRPAKT